MVFVAILMSALMSVPAIDDRPVDALTILLNRSRAQNLSSLTFILQALLSRHENYVAEAEKERRRMMEKIASLEHENVELEGSNKQTIQENRDLLEQLEALNGAIKDSETKVQSLTEVLNSTEYELERMAGLTARTERLNLQLAQLEDDLATANSVVAVTRDEHRAATLRWQQAERTINSLQAEIEKIEAEAKSERERHSEVLERVERRKAVETELNKNRPWKPQAENTTNGNGVVSHFVKDILQDNANLQLGIVELREMLQRSNDEVERLRDEFLQSPSISEMPDREGARTPSLGSELGSTREVHVHHHYHAPGRPADARKPRTHVHRRKGKQRNSGSYTPRSSISGGAQTPSSSSAILSNTTVTIPQRNSKRWSTQSSQTNYTSTSSFPNSPYNESIFDRPFADCTTDNSRPSTPDSMTLSPRTSNAFGIFDESKRDSSTEKSSELFRRSISESSSKFATLKSPPITALGQAFLHNPSHSVILEESEDLESSQHTSSSPTRQFVSDYRPHSPMRPTIRRSNSHESLISIHGMDIHTIRTRPSQLLLGKYVVTAPPTASSEVTVSDTSAFATRTSPRSRQQQNRTTSQSYLSGIAAAQKERSVSHRESRSSLTGRVGGWVWGRWGAKPIIAASSSTEDVATASAGASIRSSAASIDSTITTVTAPSSEASSSQAPVAQPVPVRPIVPAPVLSDTALSPRKMFLRPPGVNQSGPIFGFGPEKRLDPIPVVLKLDVQALQEGLEN
jgi:hypothetical protein